MFMKFWELERELKGAEDPESELAENFAEHREVERQLEGLLDPCSKLGLKFAEYRKMRDLASATANKARQFEKRKQIVDEKVRIQEELNKTDTRQREELCRKIQPCIDRIQNVQQDKLAVDAELEEFETRGWIPGDMHLSQGAKTWLDNVGIVLDEEENKEADLETRRAEAKADRLIEKLMKAGVEEMDEPDEVIEALLAEGNDSSTSSTQDESPPLEW